MSLGSTDLASGKPTSSSSVLGDLKPQLAVDSNPSSDSHKMSCFFSSFEDHPWWSVDLGHAVSVRSVTVTTRNKAGNHNSMCTWYYHVKYRHRCFVFQWLMWVICQYCCGCLNSHWWIMPIRINLEFVDSSINHLFRVQQIPLFDHWTNKRVGYKELEMSICSSSFERFHCSGIRSSTKHCDFWKDSNWIWLQAL